MRRSFISVGCCGKWWLRMLAGLILALAADKVGRAQTLTLNVTNFGARGDAVPILVSTVGNSTTLTVQSTNRFTSTDVGKVIELFGAGPATATTNQDLVTYIMSVGSGTSITISNACGITASGITGVYGTQNAGPFQAAVNACPGGNPPTIINIPAGTYLMTCPEVLNPSFLMPNNGATYPAVSISKGGIDFMGAGQGSTILLGCGAWQVKGSYVLRGNIFFCQGPVTKDAPLTFESLTMDGGSQLIGAHNYYGFPANVTNGSGWDITHDALIDASSPLHIFKEFKNCTFQNWGGEMLKSVSTWTNGFNEITNCTFINGNASAVNLSFSHTIEGCFMSNVYEGMEFYQAYCATPCLFRNNTLTNIVGAIMAINGGQANRNQPPYTITNNTFYMQHYENGIQTTPAQNVSIVRNQFLGVGTPVVIGVAGYQGTGINSNILVQGNVFSNSQFGIAVEGNGANMVAGLRVVNNTMYGGTAFAYGSGYGISMIFLSNAVAGGTYQGLNSTGQAGQYYTDDASDQFPPWQTADGGGKTNMLSYATGMRQLIMAALSSSVFAIDDAHPQQVPPGATMIVRNSASPSVPLYASATLSGSPLTLTNASTMTFAWTGIAWLPVSLTNANMLVFDWNGFGWEPTGVDASLTPPTNLHVLPVTNAP